MKNNRVDYKEIVKKHLQTMNTEMYPELIKENKQLENNVNSDILTKRK